MISKTVSEIPWIFTLNVHCNMKLFNTLVPGRSGCHLKIAIFNLVLLLGIFRSSYVNVLRRMPCDFTNDKSTLVQLITWCCQATGHLSPCWPSSMLPYGVLQSQSCIYCIAAEDLMLELYIQIIISNNVDCLVTLEYHWYALTDSGNVLLPDGTKPLPEPMST